jgi:hypothetical protein
MINFAMCLSAWVLLASCTPTSLNSTVDSVADSNSTMDSVASDASRLLDATSASDAVDEISFDDGIDEDASSISCAIVGGICPNNYSSVNGYAIDIVNGCVKSAIVLACGVGLALNNLVECRGNLSTGNAYVLSSGFNGDNQTPWRACTSAELNIYVSVYATLPMCQ